jgi:hypothetical protein
VVLRATSDRWPKVKLVVKVSWPDSLRVPESEFLEAAAKEAENPDWKWATNHLPRIFYNADIKFGEDFNFGVGRTSVR